MPETQEMKGLSVDLWTFYLWSFYCLVEIFGVYWILSLVASALQKFFCYLSRIILSENLPGIMNYLWNEQHFVSATVFLGCNNGTCHKQTGFYFHCGEDKFNIPVLLNPKEKKIRFNLTEGMLLRLTKYENHDTRFPDRFCATLFFHFHFKNSISIKKIYIWLQII